MQKSSPNLGEALRQLRQGKGWSQGQLGLAAGVSQGKVSYFERGAGVPSPEDHQRLSAALGQELPAADEAPQLLGREHPDLGANLIAARNNANLSQQELATIMENASEQELCLVEAGGIPAPHVYSRLVKLFGEAALTVTRKKHRQPYLVVVARSEQEFNGRVQELLCEGYVLRGPLHVATDAAGLVLVQDFERP